LEKTLFGTMSDGREVYAYTFGNETLCATVLSFGGSVAKLLYRGVDVVGGFDTVEGYRVGCYQGAIVGRYTNRIRDGKYVLDGVEYQLSVNEPGRGNHAQGGFSGFDQKLWDAEPFSENGCEGLVLRYTSPDGEEGYPGTACMQVRYEIRGSALLIRYGATCDRDTLFDMTNHSYFNMNGYAGGPIYDQTLQVYADFFGAVDKNLISDTWEPVDGTPFDLRTPKTLHSVLASGHEQLTFPGGLDHSFLLNGREQRDFDGRMLSKAAVFSGTAGTLTAYTDQPCTLFYAGNFMQGQPPYKGGVERKRHHALCIETEAFPDAPNRGKGILRAGERYDTMTVFSFSDAADMTEKTEA